MGFNIADLVANIFTGAPGRVLGYGGTGRFEGQVRVQYGFGTFFVKREHLRKVQ